MNITFMNGSTITLVVLMHYSPVLMKLATVG